MLVTVLLLLGPGLPLPCQRLKVTVLAFLALRFTVAAPGCGPLRALVQGVPSFGGLLLSRAFVSDLLH